jgi:cytochrome c-type protein NapB
MRRSRNLTLALAALPVVTAGVLALSACRSVAVPPSPAQPPATTGTAPATTAPPETISDRELSLGKGSVFEVQAPGRIPWETADPGIEPRLPRPYADAPPQIPHAIVDFLPISRASNGCLDCHGPAAEDGVVVTVPQSHLVDWRRSPGTVTKELAGARWVCTSCHVEQAETRPLLGNGFKSP